LSNIRNIEAATDEEDFRRGEFSLLSGWDGVLWYICFSQIQKPFDLLLAHCWEICKELVDCITLSDVIEKRNTLMMFRDRLLGLNRRPSMRSLPGFPQKVDKHKPGSSNRYCSPSSTPR